MPEWMMNVTSSEVDPTVTTLGLRLVLAWLCGMVVAWIARSRRPAGEPDTLSLTLILMSILIAMATQIIGDNIARAFSLVGALSIVRFRTAVPATRDVAFVLAAVVAGMAVGAGQYWVVGLGLSVVGLATFLNSSKADTSQAGTKDSESTKGDKKPKAWRVTLQVGLSATEGWESELSRFAESYELLSAETTRRGAAMEMLYRVTPSADSNAVEMIAALNSVPNVESVTAKVT
ncbi:DUF4956 domain-containing protein [Crateriforma conspicua]|uniref:DUF4956 domain-containing protein n=1 Tax=Crateriforma conspicua TaxID=2527996 RepID=UPI00118AFA6F|nr:DUF4956 domain-containing protein [Crateriforma conspicua]QDV62324.1 hypothetical protein Mal65_14580 [Crateriforma conspicua]